MKYNTTTIPIKKSTRDILKRCGTQKGETWDELINKLMKIYNNSL